MNKYYQHNQYFGRFPLLEGLILARYKNVTNFCKDNEISIDVVNNYLRGKADPSFAFIKKCLFAFGDFTFEELFEENCEF